MVNSAYDHLNDGGARCPFAKNIWNIKAPLKVKAFLWLVVNRAILTLDNLMRRSWQG